MKKRILSLLLCAALFAGLIPATAVPAVAAALAGEETIGDQYITATVSKKNGGFLIRTVEGDRLKKSDNDKDLLYHDGQFDTSFLSFRVGEGQEAKDYLFGGKYTAEGSTKVAVTKSPAGDSISAVWSLTNLGLTFTQTLSLNNDSSDESGMISISVKVENTGSTARQVQARLLLDTYLGSQDYGYYQYVTGDAGSEQTKTIQQETVIEGAAIPTQIYAADDPYSSSIRAYSVHPDGSKPTKVAFGHWSHLAATLFEFTPNGSLGFTNSLSEYMTADSAYALYYDLGSVAANGEASLNTFYGVFSNHQTPANNAVAVNVTAPVRLELNDDKTAFVPLLKHGVADFSVTVDFANINKEDAVDLANVALAVQSTGNLRSLRDDGTEANDQTFTTTDPYCFSYTNVKVGESRTKTLYFQAQLTDEARYERITIGVYDTSGSSSQGITAENKLGERTVYILLPGRDGTVPKVSFAAMSPDIIYHEGTRHLFVTVTNKSMLDDKGNWTMKAYSVEEKGDEAEQQVVTIPSNTITIDGDGVMDIPITETMKTGEWYLQLEWTDNAVSSGVVPAALQKQTAPELQFSVSNDFKYRNDGYGILAVVEYPVENSKNMKYEIMPFTSQEAFDGFIKDHEDSPTDEERTNYTEIVLTFKGSFTVTKKNGNDAVCYTAVSKKTIQSDGTYKVENPIVVNDCLDFEGGTLSVYYEDSTTPSWVTGALSRGYSSAVCTEFDGELYTNGARTEVWKGKAVLTKLMQNYGNYSLAVYDEDGNRGYLTPDNNYPYGKFEDSETGFEAQGNEGIYLIWPSGGEIGRTLAGMIFNLTYGQFGTMYDTDGYGGAEEIVGNVISFAAAMDMTFIQGQVNQNERGPDTYWSKIKDLWTWEFKTGQLIPYENYDEWMRLSESRDWSTIDESGENKNERKVSGSVMVRDVLFGCGEGFVGVNFSVGATLKNYITGLPELDATININTVNNWAFGVEGTMELANFKIEANISFKSKDNIPVPDEIYFFIGGFEPGWNIDNLAVVWITGGGGGIENLYDSIFATKAVPPLKLVLSVSFDILKVLSCERATLAVGLTGVSLRAEDIHVKGVRGLTAFDHIGLSLEWYPGIDMRASIGVNLFQGLVKGSGYLVLISPDYQDVFFEIFARCTLNVPESIPVVGGMQVAGADLGINSDRIWGAIEVLGITLGVTYYWGAGSVDFSNGSKAHPTFPDLLGYDDIPVGYDKETDRTLYMRVGTNTRLLASSLPDDGSLVLMASGNEGAKLTTIGDTAKKNKFKFNLGSRGSTNAIVQITYAAESKAQAEALADLIMVGSTDGGNDYGLIRYNGSNLSTANANLTYDGATGLATYSFTATTDDKYRMDWYMTTPKGSDVMLYGVDQTPEVNEVNGAISNSNQLTLNWEGNSAISELDQISFYLCESNDPNSGEAGHRIGVVSDSATLGTTKPAATLPIPADVPTGDYYIRAVYSKADEVNGVVFSANTVNWTNNNTPGAINSFDATPAGNLQYKLVIPKAGNTTGYLVTIYEADGKTVTDFEQVNFDAAETGDTTTINVGGSYTIPDPEGSTKAKTFGLTGDKSYIIGVTPYKEVASGSGTIAIRGTEVRTSAVYLPRMVTPTVSFTADKTPKSRTIQEKGLLANGTVGMVNVTKKVYTSDAINFTATFSEAVTGTWLLDDSVLANVGTPVAGINNSTAPETAAAKKKDQGASFTSSTTTVQISLTGLADGEHTLTLEGAGANGDSFYTTYTFVVDTLPPQLLISSPVNGSFFNKDGTVTITGITDAGANLTIAGTAKTIEQWAATTGSSFDSKTGRFVLKDVAIPDAHSASQHTLTISASDDVGNISTPQTVTLSHGGLADLKSLEVSVNGTIYQYGNIPVPADGLNGATLNLVGVTSDEKKFNITGDNVYWEIQTVEGSASITDGKLTAGAFSQGIITGKLAVATTGRAAAFRTASLCFGAPGDHIVSVSHNIGGTVTGGGEYAPNATVTLTATPESGYRFAGWTIVGATVADTSASTISFPMPQTGNVTAEARFEPTSSSTPGTAGPADSGTSAQAGELVEVALPAGKSESDYLPYYLDESGEKVFVPISAVVDSKVRFIAPQTGRYYFGANDVAFTDIAGRWSEQSILFAASRGIFNGIGNGQFAPEAVMDRAMVIAVLYRLAGSPAVSGSSGYTDVADGRWYSDAVTWGKSTGIINGYGDGSFGVGDPITREQLCAMMTRFLAYMDYGLSETADGTAFTDANDISNWAAEAVTYCQTRGLVNGIPGGAFAPQAGTTREQCCAVIERLIRAVLRMG